VVDSVGDFVAWLLPGPESLLGLPPISYSYCPSITSEDSSELPLSDEDMSIVWYLYGAPSHLLACFTFQHSTPATCGNHCDTQLSVQEFDAGEPAPPVRRLFWVARVPGQVAGHVGPRAAHVRPQARPPHRDRAGSIGPLLPRPIKMADDSACGGGATGKGQLREGAGRAGQQRPHHPRVRGPGGPAI
jgi:hypothetical protein